MMKKQEPLVTAVLSNGLVVRVPLKDSKNTLAKMEENLKYHSQVSDQLTINELKSLIIEIKDKALAKEILDDINKNPKAYDKYLTLSKDNAVANILADWG